MNLLPTRELNPHDPIGQWMVRAYQVASLSPDPSTQNGAICLDGLGENSLGHKISSACNDATQGVNLTDKILEHRPTKLLYMEHAERAALHKAHQFARTLPKVMVCPWASCADCARAIVSSGIRRLIRHSEAISSEFRPSWKDSLIVGDEILRAGGVKVEHWSGNCGITILRNGRLTSF